MEKAVSLHTYEECTQLFLPASIAQPMRSLTGAHNFASLVLRRQHNLGLRNLVSEFLPQRIAASTAIHSNPLQSHLLGI